MSKKSKATAETDTGKSALVPKLRFPEFSNDAAWVSVRLGNCSIPVTERVGAKTLTPISISAGIGFVPQAKKFGRDISGNQYSLYTHVKKGDFVFNKGNSLKYPQGCVYQLKDWDEVAAPNVFISFRLKTGYDPAFYGYCFEKNLHGQQLKRFITSGARSNGLLNISKDTFFGISLPCPRGKEQRKIADCLSSLDDLITAQVQRVGALKLYKKGLMQLLFPAEGETVPKLRFHEFRNAPEWAEKKLADICQIYKGKGISKVNVTAEGKTLCIRYGELYTYYGEVIRDVISKTDSQLDDLFLSKVNDVIIPASGETKEDIATASCVLIGGVALGGDLNVIRTSNNGMFLSYYLNGPLRSEIAKVAQGHTVVHLYPSQLNGLDIKVPNNAEQKKIANSLSSLDELITAQTQKVEVLKAHKKGLMQQLFPSRDDQVT